MKLTDLQKENEALRKQLSEARGRLPRAAVGNPDAFLTLAEAGETLDLLESQVREFVDGEVTMQRDDNGRDIIPRADFDKLLVRRHLGQDPAALAAKRATRIKGTL